jgi:hypothetical protein
VHHAVATAVRRAAGGPAELPVQDANRYVPAHHLAPV